MMINMVTKPKGIHATFATTCTCGRDLTVTNGRIDLHDCRPPSVVTLDDIEWPDQNLTLPY